jgi:glutamate formiminotransferase / 5-formyltetrahydrofolate cyclo-ligase
MRIIEAVPNFSEGRRDEVVDQILNAFRGSDNCQLLDHHADPDHNRLVVTVIGEPEAVVEACFAAARVAADLIDMDKHSGSHPRIGATDVIPLLPVRGVDMKECVQLAEALGERLASELGIPVYLYEEAARRPERRSLEVIRRGEYETLKAEIALEHRHPDLGAPQIHPTAGATVVGARQPLIAYNVYLQTSDVSVAKEIARAVRGSSGGFVNVKAIGMDVEGDVVQVSMNLTDFRRTPMHRVFEFIKREALHRGVTVQRSEVVGLLPQAAVIAAARYYLRLADFSPQEQILERRLESEK